jgi:hypothetical protein
VPNGFAATTSTELGAAPAEPHLFGEPDSAKGRALRWDPLLAYCGEAGGLPSRATTIHQEHANVRPAGLATDFRS